MAHSGSKSVIYAALAGNFAIAITKFTASFFTGSAAMMSEGVHSLVDTGNQILLLYGIKQSGKAPTVQHPFGYGLRLYFWAFVVAILIFGLGAGVSIIEGINKITHPHEIEKAWINYIVLIFGIIFEGSVWLVAFKEFSKSKGKETWIKAIRDSKDPAVFTVLFEDTAALLGLVVALLGIFLSQLFNMPILDGVASVIIGIILAITASFLAFECQSLLTGEGISLRKRQIITDLALNSDGVNGVNEVLSMYFGPDNVLIALSLDFDDNITAAQVEKTVSYIEKLIKEHFPEVNKVFIEAQSFEAHAKFSGESIENLSDN